MKLICALILWQVLLQVSKEETVSAEPNQQSEVIDSKNNDTQILKEEVRRLKRELESKNDQLKDSQDTETELRRELENKYESVGKCSMPTVRAELNRQHRIMEKLEKNLNEKQKDETSQLMSTIYSGTKDLRQCEMELTSLKNTITRMEKNGKSCIEKDSSGAHWVRPCQAFEVLCNSDIAGPGWNVIQQRIDGKVDFYRDWNSYRDGFGDFWDGSFFLGLEKIHRLTAEEPHELYIHMERFNGSSYFARYDEFAIAGEDDQYRLIKLGAFSGSTEDDMMKWNKNMKFTTYDRDNDASDYNCAKICHGGWWYQKCTDSNLNGRYFTTEVEKKDTISWEGYTSLKQVKMMIRPKVTSK